MYRNKISILFTSVLFLSVFLVTPTNAGETFTMCRSNTKNCPQETDYYIACVEPHPKAMDLCYTKKGEGVGYNLGLVSQRSEGKCGVSVFKVTCL